MFPNFCPTRTKTKTRKSEWIEIANTGGTDINLGNWQIDDKERRQQALHFPRHRNHIRRFG